MFIRHKNRKAGLLAKVWCCNGTE